MQSQVESEPRHERPPDRTERRRIATRARLLAAARTVFARQGLAEATIAQIAEEADLGFGTFYLYFPTKEDAYRAVVTEGFAELSERLDATQAQAAASGQAWWQVVRLSVATYFAFAAENRELFVAMCAGGDIGAGLGREIQERFEVHIARALPETQRAAGSSEGMYPYPPMWIARAVVAALDHAVLCWIREEDEDEESSPGGPVGNSARLSLEALTEAMSRFVAAGLGGYLPGDDG